MREGVQKIHLDFNVLPQETPDAPAPAISRKEYSEKEPKIGERMPDGTIYAGISPETGRPVYAMPADAPLTLAFNEAKDFVKLANARKFPAHGYKDWRLPSRAELNLLFNNRAAIGGFDINGSDPSGRYWSSSSVNRWDTWGQRFSDGCQDNGYRFNHSSVRLVRSPPSTGPQP